MLFLVFAGDNYYPAGGWDDFKEAFTTHEEALAKAEEYAKHRDWVQVVNLAEELGVEPPS